MVKKNINSGLKEEQILKKCFDCLVINGLERASIRDFCAITRMSSSSLYYRFKNKNEIVLEAAVLGLKSIAEELFWVAVVKIRNYTELFDSIVCNVDLRRARIRLIYQIATSPKYGDEFRQKSTQISSIYFTYGSMIAKDLMCPVEVLTPYANLFIAAIREYVVWEDKERLWQELNHIYNELSRVCGE